MFDTESRTEAIIRAVDTHSTSKFDTMQIASESAITEYEKDTSLAFQTLERMKCVKKLTKGAPWHPAKWKVIFEPDKKGKKCEGCPFINNPLTKCARRERLDE